MLAINLTFGKSKAINEQLGELTLYKKQLRSTRQSRCRQNSDC